MVYTSNSHLSGAAITAAHAENWETQYNEIKKTYFDKFSTASTGTVVLNQTSTSTYLQLTTSFVWEVVVPPMIQQSRLEFSVTAQRLSTTVAAKPTLYLMPGIYGGNYVSGAYPACMVLQSSFSTAAAGWTTNAGFSCWGGEHLSLVCLNPGTSDVLIWDIKISGTSTTLSEVASSWFPFNRTLAAAPTSTG